MNACKKDDSHPNKGPDCSQRATEYISSEISNFKFKKGSYWIFIDSVSLAIDTMRVDTSSGGIYNDYYCPNNQREDYQFITSHKPSLNLPNEFYLLSSNVVTLNQHDYSPNGSEIYLNYSPKTDSLFIYDRYYKSVVAYTRLIDGNENGNKSIRYMNTTFGFLKKEVYNSSNQLVSKKVLKDKLIIR